MRAPPVGGEGLKGSGVLHSLPCALGSPKGKYTLTLHNKNVHVGWPG